MPKQVQHDRQVEDDELYYGRGGISAASNIPRGARTRLFSLREETGFFLEIYHFVLDLLILNLSLILTYQPGPVISGLLLNEWFLVILTILSCYLLNAELPLFALKFSDWGFQENKMRYLFIISCLVLLVLLKFLAIPIILLLYVLLSIISNRNSIGV